MSSYRNRLKFDGNAGNVLVAVCVDIFPALAELHDAKGLPELTGVCSEGYTSLTSTALGLQGPNLALPACMPWAQGFGPQSKTRDALPILADVGLG